MRPKARQGSLACLMLAAFAAIAGAQAQIASPGAQTPPTSPGPVPGYFDPATNSFKTLGATPSTSTSDRSGTIKVVGNIDINSGIPSHAPITATALISASEASGLVNSALISGTVTRTSPGKGSVTLTLPFVWQVPSGSVPISVIFTVNATITNSSAGTTLSWSNSTTASATLPADGKTTVVTVNDAL